MKVTKILLNTSLAIIGSVLLAAQVIPLAAVNGAPHWRPLVEAGSIVVQDKNRFGNVIVQKRFLGIMPIVSCSTIDGIEAAVQRCGRPIEWQR